MENHNIIDNKVADSKEQEKNNMLIANILDKYNKSILELNIKNQKRRLSKEQERSLINSIRFRHLSHSDLISLSIDTIMEEYKDLILIGLSARLNYYESSNKEQNIEDNLLNSNPRKYLSDQKSYLENYKLKGKL